MLSWEPSIFQETSMTQNPSINVFVDTGLTDPKTGLPMSEGETLRALSDRGAPDRLKRFAEDYFRGLSERSRVSSVDASPNCFWDAVERFVAGVPAGAAVAVYHPGAWSIQKESDRPSTRTNYTIDDEGRLSPAGDGRYWLVASVFGAPLALVSKKKSENFLTVLQI